MKIYLTLLFVFLACLATAVLTFRPSAPEPAIAPRFERMAAERVGGQWVTVFRDNKTSREYLVIEANRGVAVVTLP